MKVCNINKSSNNGSFSMSKCACGGPSNCNCGSGSVCAHKCANGISVDVKKTIKEIYKK